MDADSEPAFVVVVVNSKKMVELPQKEESPAEAPNEDDGCYRPPYHHLGLGISRLTEAE